MKDIKFPLCGTNSEYFLCEIGTNPCYATTAKLFGCPTCKIGFNHPDGWKEYVSKFPPIMRVQVGDKIRHIHQFSPYRGTPEVIERVDVESGIIKASGCSSYLRPSSITTWPWELEQKGGK